MNYRAPRAEPTGAAPPREGASSGDRSSWLAIATPTTTTAKSMAQWMKERPSDPQPHMDGV